jgi:hypothetical protein
MISSADHRELERKTYRSSGIEPGKPGRRIRELSPIPCAGSGTPLFARTPSPTEPVGALCGPVVPFAVSADPDWAVDAMLTAARFESRCRGTRGGADDVAPRLVQKQASELWRAAAGGRSRFWSREGLRFLGLRALGEPPRNLVCRAFGLRHLRCEQEGPPRQRRLNSTVSSRREVGTPSWGHSRSVRARSPGACYIPAAQGELGKCTGITIRLPFLPQSALHDRSEDQ